MRRALGHWVLLLAAACSSDDTTTEDRSYTDEAGRSCIASIEKTSPSSPVVGEKLSCDGEANSCSADAAPCFQLSEESETGVLRNCPACCKGNSSSFVSADCSPVVCEADEQCVFKNASCVEGRCVCPAGFCDD